VVTELQQSTARLSAVGTVIKKQLEQLNAQLLEQRQLLSQERMNGLNMHGESRAPYLDLNLSYHPVF
jgi:hypothetical protein